MPNIRKRGQTWQAQVRRAGYPALSKSFSTRADAVTWAREKERSIDRAELPTDIKELKRLTVADLLKRYEREITPRKRGALFERSRIRQLSAHRMSQTSLSNLSAATVIAATQYLAVAYRSAGLLWAARAACLTALAAIVIEGEEDNRIPVVFIPTLKLWAWLSLSLRHIPDFLSAVQLLNGSLRAMPLTEETKERVKDDIRELESALGCVVLNLSDSEIQKLESVPDILDGLGLFMARAALLYTLGYAESLRADKSLPPEETDETVHRMFSILASQPLAEETQGILTVNENGEQRLETSILGMRIEVVFEGTDTSFVVAETLLGTLEAFFATSIDQKVIAHTDRFKISLIESPEALKPTVVMKPLDMEAIATWPKGLSAVNYERHGEIRTFFAEVSANILVTTMVVNDVAALLDKLHADEATHHRTAMVAAAPNSFHRFMSCSVSRLSNWKEAIRDVYPLKPPRPELDHIDLPEGPDDDEDGDDYAPPKSHRRIRVQTVVNANAWDSAHWKATGFLQYRDRPGIAFVFMNEEAGKKIFERWKGRFGSDDAKNDIYLAIIRNLPDQSPNDYLLMVTANPEIAAGSDPRQAIILTSRSMTMTPSDSRNLNRFLAAFEATQEFYLMPATFAPGGGLTMFHELAILKRTLSVREAKDIGPNDVERTTLRMRGLTQ